MSGELIAGVGLRRMCSAEAIASVVRAAMAAVGRPVCALAAPEFKRGEAGLAIAAQMLGLELLFMDDAALLAVQPLCVTHSALAAQTVGLSSVAEASALAAAAPARLLLPRLTGQGATCAIAQRA